tara:strand:+ start:852 stop:1013 length:162 start_codon:yes stop_codon:yes gene_type:complete
MDNDKKRNIDLNTLPLPEFTILDNVSKHKKPKETSKYLDNILNKKYLYKYFKN